jgi:hypothetical protein
MILLVTFHFLWRWFLYKNHSTILSILQTGFNTGEEYNKSIAAYDLLQKGNVPWEKLVSDNTLSGGESATDVIKYHRWYDTYFTQKIVKLETCEFYVCWGSKSKLYTP